MALQNIVLAAVGVNDINFLHEAAVENEKVLLKVFDPVKGCILSKASDAYGGSNSEIAVVAGVKYVAKFSDDDIKLLADIEGLTYQLFIITSSFATPFSGSVTATLEEEDPEHPRIIVVHELYQNKIFSADGFPNPVNFNEEDKFVFIKRGNINDGKTFWKKDGHWQLYPLQVTRGKNWINKSDGFSDMSFDLDSGELQEETGYFATNFIKTSGETFTVSGYNSDGLNKTLRVLYFDRNFNLMSYDEDIPASADAEFNADFPTGTAFVRLSFGLGNIDTVQLEEGTEASVYEEFRYTFSNPAMIKGLDVPVDNPKYVFLRLQAEDDGSGGYQFLAPVILKSDIPGLTFTTNAESIIVHGLPEDKFINGEKVLYSDGETVNAIWMWENTISNGLADYSSTGVPTQQLADVPIIYKIEVL